MDDLNEVPEPIRRALNALDQDAERAAARVDAGRVADRVLARLREEPVVVAPRPGYRGAVLRIAAALALLITGVVVARRMTAPATPAVVNETATLPVSLGSDTLSTGQADQLLAAVDSARTDSSATVTSVVSVDDLTETELQALLATLQRGGDEQ